MQYANLNLLRVIVVACFLTGCVSGTATLKGYKDIPREQAAVLLAKRLCTPNWAFNLDLPGIHQLREHCGTAGCSEFILPPGRYHVFYSCGSHFAKGTTSVEFEVVILEAGHQYTIDFNGWFGAYHAVLVDMLTGKKVSRERN